MIELTHGERLRLARAVVYHVPGRGFVTVPQGAEVEAVGLDTLTPTIRRAVQASAQRDEQLRGVSMVLVHVLGQPRLMDIDDVERGSHVAGNG